ncbi:Os1348 family NHLP clan protein [Rhizohabitans arisaemae]|uniref:Os1348 family NHLP clan protein n=1 Tax=Rhizohabitans arisaemae TaxID=2720610 RepID=UPI0024B22CBB|nr:Os1348 family NHLP clan protein [Rhizohabitans arisaemae]
MTDQDLTHIPAERTEIKVVLERAIADPAFGELLLNDPDTALAEYELTDVQTLLLRSLDEDDLAKLTPQNLDEYFEVGSAVYTPDDAHLVNQGYEMYDKDELEG